MDFIVVGGGIIGLSLAYELVTRGASVTLIEQGQWGGEASQAAAGMLAPYKEFKEDGPLFELGRKSLSLYPEWALQLENETGIEVQLKRGGILTVAASEADIREIQAKYVWQKQAGCNLEWLTGDALHEREPLLSAKLQAGIFSPDEGDVNNQLLLKALHAACQRRGVKLLAGHVVTGLITSGERITGVKTAAGEHNACHTVLTAGAWAGIMAEWLGYANQVRPVRGQIAAVSSVGIPLRHVVFGPDGYLVPKRDGRIILGATEDEAGYCREVTAGGISRVLQGVQTIIPSVANAAFLQAWAGLRPASLDGLPLLGPIPDWAGISMAAGHFRNGILLAPVTAKLMADWLVDGKGQPLAPFDPGRLRELHTK
ncbi:glycine oxidase ThiO [Brevibacillus migulae]|uniref:glycine oxidase ThiO n=1 Tax=Brevibacillus migulae TaxID=1644114 RepID=UPI00106E50CB|nr:glycine oxidase ThiO [Brevibacillus migulae]